MRDRNERQKTNTFTFCCISAQKGAKEVSCPEIHGLAAVWRSILKDLPQRDRVGLVRKQGFVVMVDLEALTRAKERRLSTDTNTVGMSMHPPIGRPKATRVYLCNRLL